MTVLAGFAAALSLVFPFLAGGWYGWTLAWTVRFLMDLRRPGPETGSAGWPGALRRVIRRLVGYYLGHLLLWALPLAVSLLFIPVFGGVWLVATLAGINRLHPELRDLWMLTVVAGTLGGYLGWHLVRRHRRRTGIQ